MTATRLESSQFTITERKKTKTKQQRKPQHKHRKKVSRMGTTIEIAAITESSDNESRKQAVSGKLLLQSVNYNNQLPQKVK